MSRQTRRLSNPPEYYYQLDSKQQTNWRRNTRRIERNEEVREQYPRFQSPSNVTVVHVHYRTSVKTVDQLIQQARRTARYAIDTESEMINGQPTGALVQIQFVRSTDYSTIVLFETCHLPERNSTLFAKIEELCSIIFEQDNEIISWGTLKNEFKNFRTLGLFESRNRITELNLQDSFGDGHERDKKTTHPGRERRGEVTWSLRNNILDTPGEESPATAREASDHEEQRTNWSLQDAIAATFNEFLDKSETNGKWTCGLDLELDTWKLRLFSRNRYNPMKEKEKRLLMIKYAIDDCQAVTRLYSRMNSANTIPESQYETPTTNTYQTVSVNRADEHEQILFPDFDRQTPSSTTTTNTPHKAAGIIHSDGLPEIFIPRFNRTTNQVWSVNRTLVSSVSSPYDERIELTLQPTREEVQQVVSLDEQRRVKAERQRKKNEKYKWKKRNLPNFNHKIRRPMYHEYDYRKIRSQLADDNIHTSHQVTINKKYGEVMIGFKSDEDLQRAKSIMKINYFSKEQFNERWGK